MTTNETPYRPQVNDHVILDGSGVIIEDDHDRMPYLIELSDGSTRWVRESDIKLISRADGVPVEKSTPPSAAQAESDEEIALDLATKMRSGALVFVADGNNWQVSEAHALCLEEIADNAEHYRRAGVPVEKDAATVGIDSIIANEVNARKAVEVERDELRKQLAEVISANSDVNSACMKEALAVDNLRKELAEAVGLVGTGRGFVALTLSDTSPNNMAGRIAIPRMHKILACIDAFLARHQPPSAVDTQQVNRE